MEAPSEPTQAHACARVDGNTARELLDEIEPSSLCQSRGRGFKSRRARHEMRHKQRATASNRGPLSLQHLSICVRHFAICPRTVTKLADRTIPSLRQSSHGTLHIS